jgi:lysophospholipase L1-like esterase
LIQKQDVTSAEGPLLLWGPYLWAEGEKGRQIDDLVYLPGDFNRDGVHPSEGGREKVAKQLLEFFATHPLAKGWFAK